MTAPPDQPAAGDTPLPAVRMDRGLLLCPACDSTDLVLGDEPGVLVCEACGQRSSRSSNQCQRCGAAGVRRTEQIAFPAPGQSPAEAKTTVVVSCDACGYRSNPQ